MERMESDAERISFTHTILEITEQVTKAEIEQIKFLCSEHIPIGTLENMDATDIMQSLSDRRIITAEKFDFLAECLILLGRMDMAKQLGCQSEVIDGYCNNLAQFKSTGGLSRFKLLLFHFADNLTREEVKKIILYLDGKVTFPKGKMGSSFSAFDLLTFLIKAQFLHPSKLHNLTDISDRLNRLDLKERIDVYSASDQKSSDPKSASDQKSSDPKSASDQKSSDPKSASDQKSSDPKSEDVLESYQMTARPRGICLIFNNEIFEKHRNRRGSSIDKERLKQTFEKLWFDVKVFENCTKRKVQNILQEVGSMDHSKYNCFVCCILSHGKEKSILAVDGEPLSYLMFTTPFKPNNCKSLSGKPKLFFIQACQGDQFQGGTSDWEMDSAVPAVGTLIPNEADFLMAHATVHGFVSFRSVSRGSLFIQNLCNVFEEHAARFDLSHLLLMVNNRVSKEVGDPKQGLHIQVPAPLSTLRKRLFFLNEGD